MKITRRIALLLTFLLSLTAALPALAAEPKIVKISAGYHHVLALADNGDLYAWGRNEFGEVGNGTTKIQNTPVLIGSGFSDIAAGYRYSLALKESSLYAWGYNNFGQLGDGTKTTRTIPLFIGSGFSAIAAGHDHSLGLKGSSLYAWGANYHGCLGDGTTTDRTAPTLIDSGFPPSPQGKVILWH